MRSRRPARRTRAGAATSSGSGDGEYSRPTVAEISKTADQALGVLSELADAGPMTAAEVSRSLNLNRTVVYRLLTTLQRRGYVVRHGDTYSPGPMLVRIAETVEPELRAAAAQVMRGLAEQTGETVVLHIQDGDDAVVLEQVVGTGHVLRVQHRVGSRHPLCFGASGRALLASLDDRVLARAVETSEDPDMTRNLIDDVRRAGYALSHDELQDGVYGLAVPVRSVHDAVASLAILVPAPRAADVLDHLPELREAADRLSVSLDALR